VDYQNPKEAGGNATRFCSEGTAHVNVQPIFHPERALRAPRIEIREGGTLGPGAPMAKVRIGRQADFAPGKLSGVNVNGKMVLVVNLGGKLYAIDGICTHMNGKLWEGKLVGNNVKCPQHGTEYDVRNGRMMKRPAYPFGVTYDLKVYPITVEGDEVMIDL